MTSKNRRNAWLTAGILLVGANLRMPITMIPPLLPSLRHTLGLASAQAGLLTSIPLLMFALISPLVALIGARRGHAQTLHAALILLTIGVILRAISGIPPLFAGTALIGAGIAGGNVLLPAIIKAEFPQHVAAKTTLYTSMQVLVASVGTAGAGLLAPHFGLSGTMLIFGSIALMALLVWTRTLPMQKQPVRPTHTAKAAPARNVWRAPRAWAVLGYFGLQSVLYYTLLTWLPSLWQAGGFTPAAAGTLATCFQLSGLPLSLTVPSIAERRGGLTILNTGIAAGFILGAAGLLLGSSSMAFNATCAILMGLASGAAFSICIVFFQKRTDDPRDTADLSGMAQAGGYVLAAIGPVGIGILQQRTGSYGLLLTLTLALTAIMAGLGVLIIRSRSVFADSATKPR